MTVNVFLSPFYSAFLLAIWAPPWSRRFNFAWLQLKDGCPKTTCGLTHGKQGLIIIGHKQQQTVFEDVTLCFEGSAIFLCQKYCCFVKPYAFFWWTRKKYYQNWVLFILETMLKLDQRYPQRRLSTHLNSLDQITVIFCSAVYWTTQWKASSLCRTLPRPNDN